MSLLQLVPIPRCEWPELRDLFRDGWPENEIPFNAVQNYLNWTERDPKIRHLEILGLGGSWRQNGTFLVMDRHELFFFTLEQSGESLQRALELVDWDYSYRIFAILDRHQAVMERVLDQKGISLRNAHLLDADQQFRMLKEDVSNGKVPAPSGYRLADLEVRHARFVNENWAYRSSASEYAIKRCIAWNTSVALFNENDDLVAWCLLNNLGIVCLLQTDERYRRMGFGEIVLREMVKKLAERGMNASASITPENFASQSLFEKVGFKREQIVYYTHFKVDRLMEWNFY